MSMSRLHSASVPTRVPSTSRIASSKKAEGCWAQTRRRAMLKASIRATTSGSAKRRQKSPAVGGGVGDPSGAQGVEEGLVVAPGLDVLDPGAAGAEVEGDVEDVVGFVVGEVVLEEQEVAVDVADRADPPGDQEHGADAAGGEAPGAV